MESKNQTAKTTIVKAALTGALAGAFIGVLWLAIEIPWLESRQKETWPQWIGFAMLFMPTAFGGAWAGGGIASAIIFVIQVSKGRMSRAMIMLMTVLLTLWAFITVAGIKKYSAALSPATAHGQPPRAVGRQLPDEKIPEMTAALEDPDPQVRCSAASSLFAVKRPELAQASVPRLIELTTDASSCVRGAAIETLGRLAPTDARVFAAAQTLLKDDDVDVKWRAANTLVACSCKSNMDINFVESLARSPDYSKNLKIRFVRIAGCQNANGLGVLKSLLSSQDERLQREALVEISRIIVKNTEAPASLSAFEALKNSTPVSDAARKLRDSAINQFEMIRARHRIDMRDGKQ